MHPDQPVKKQVTRKASKVKRDQFCALTVALDGSEDGHIHCFKENQPCRAGLERLKVVQQAMSNSRDKDPFDGITESDDEDAAPDSLIIDASDTEVIDVE